MSKLIARNKTTGLYYKFGSFKGVEHPNAATYIENTEVWANDLDWELVDIYKAIYDWLSERIEL